MKTMLRFTADIELIENGEVFTEERAASASKEDIAMVIRRLLQAAHVSVSNKQIFLIEDSEAEK